MNTQALATFKMTAQSTEELRGEQSRQMLF